MNKNRKTSHILNVFQFDANGHVILPATLTIGENPHSSDNTSKIPSTSWIRTYVTGLSYLTGNQSITVSGDATGSGTTAITLTLANTAVTPGTYGSTTLVPVVTVDSKGRITSVTTAAISGSLTFTGDVTGTGTTGTSTGLTLAASGVTAGTYTKVTVDSKGRVTVGANASTTDISEGTRLYYTDARVLTYLTANSYATQSYVGTQIANLVASAPATLDTLNELSVALGNDPNFATSVATSIGTKQAQLNGTGFVKVIGTTVSYDNNTYLTSFTETDPTVPSHVKSITTTEKANWNTAYGWGNHASGGYLTGITSSQVTTALGYTPYNSTNPSGYITGITSSNVTTALGYTPYNSTNPSGYITGITSGNVTTALGYTPYNSTNPSGYITGINSSAVTTALGFTPLSSSGNVTIGGYLTVTGAGTSSSIYMSDTDEGQREIHCNSNRIGFLTQAGAWGAYCDDSGNFFAANLSGTNTGDQTNISGNAATATNVAWTGVTGRPTAVSQFTNDSGYITGVTNISGYSGSVSIPDWRNTSYTPAQYDGNRVNWHFNNTGYNNSPPGDFWGVMQTVSPWSEFNTSHRQSQLWWGGSVGLSYRYAVGSGYTPTGWSAWETIITSATIGAQSVSYATTSGNAASVNSKTVGNGKGNIGYFDSVGNLYITNPETYTGEVRLGAAWARGGVYASSTLSMSTSSGNINFVSNDTTIGGFRWDSANGTRFIVGLDANVQTPYTLVDANKRPIMYARGAYPALVLDHTETSNTNHGPTIQFVFNGLDARQWLIGAAGNGSKLDFGMSNAAYGNTSYNPHNGIAGYTGKTVMRMTETGVLFGDCGTYPTINTASHPLQVNGTAYISSTLSMGGYIRMGVFPNSTTNTGEAWIGRASDRNAGTMTVQLGGNSASNRSFEVVDYGWSVVMFSVNSSNGNVTASGDITAYSDIRVKENIVRIDSALNKIKSINGYYFNRTDVADKTKKIGFIAQEVLEVVPEIVNYNIEQDRYSISYGNTAALLVEAIKEQQLQIEELKKQIEYLVENK